MLSGAEPRSPDPQGTSRPDPPLESHSLRDIIKRARQGKPTRAKQDELDRRKRRRADGESATPTQSPVQNARALPHDTTLHLGSQQPESEEVILGSIDDDGQPIPSPAPSKDQAKKQPPPSLASSLLSSLKASSALPEPQPPPTQVDLSAPQVQFVNGKIVIDKSSLVITAGPEPDALEEFSLIREGASHLTSATYSNRVPTERWSKLDTERFYQALREFGTDFSMMSRSFPTRNRNQLKNKYKREDREHPHLVAAALSSRLSVSEMLSLVSNTLGHGPSAITQLPTSPPQTVDQRATQVHEPIPLPIAGESSMIEGSIMPQLSVETTLGLQPETNPEQTTQAGDPSVSALEALQRAAEYAAQEFAQNPPDPFSLDHVPVQGFDESDPFAPDTPLPDHPAPDSF